MAERLPWFPFYPADWLTDERVMSLSYELRGIYLQMLCFQWREGSLPADEGSLARLLGLTDAQISQALARLKPCFRERKGRLINSRLERIREERLSYHRSLSEAGRRGGKVSKRKRKRDKPGSSQAEARALLKPGSSKKESESESEQEPPIVPQGGQPTPKRTKKKRTILNDGADHFKAFWEIYPRKKAKAAALKAFRKALNAGVEPGTVIAGVKRYASEQEGREARYIAHAATWLNQARWEDEPEPLFQKPAPEEPDDPFERGIDYGSVEELHRKRKEARERREANG